MPYIRSLRTAALLLSALGAACAHGPVVTPPQPRVAITRGVSQELARVRAATLREVRYDMIVDLTGEMRARGRVGITFDRLPGAHDLVLDFRGPALDSVRVNDTALPIVDWHDGHVVIPSAFLLPGANRIDALFQADIAAAGASIIRYRDDSDSTEYVYTLLVPADANQLFPSFDQPDLKARVTFHAIVPDAWRVLANGPEVARVPLDAGRVRYDFAETQPISTYLIAFAAGPWRVLANADSAEVPSSLWVRSSRAEEVDADTLLATSHWARSWLQDYFERPFPFAKMDLLLAPAFPFGGMEHVGAIFYNENSFIFREPPTLVQVLGRDATIYHEVAHQWFGDLVTMRWFDDLWLKEGFATYMAARLQAERSPDSGAWKSFYLRNKPLAYGVDETAGTTPVWQALPSLDLAKSNYGPIVYNKAPSVLKQLVFLVGEDAFRRGVRRFLEKYAYENASWEDLLETLGGAAGMDLTTFGEQYMLRAGMPVIEPTLTLDSTGIASLVLTQRPARDLPDDPGGTWPMRLRMRLAYAGRPDTVVTVLLTGARTPVDAVRGLPAPLYVFANEDDHGYGQFLLDDRSAAYLLENVHRIEDDLRRAMVWGSLWDLMRAGRLAPDAFASRALAALPLEDDEQIAAQLTGRTAAAIARYTPPGANADRLAAIFEDLLLERANRAGSYGMRRTALNEFFDFARTDRARAVLRAYLAERRHFEGEPLRQPSRWAALTRLIALDDRHARTLLEAEIERDTTPDAERQAFIAAAAVPTAAGKRAYFERYLNDSELNEEWVTASLDAFNEPLHAQLVLPYLRPALEQAEWLRDHRRIFFLPAWLNSFIGAHATPAALAVVDAFLAATPALPDDIRRKILLPRDQLERVVRVRSGTANATY